MVSGEEEPKREKTRMKMRQIKKNEMIKEIAEKMTQKKQASGN